MIGTTLRCLELLLRRPMSVKDLAFELGVSRRQVYRALKFLSENGYVERMGDVFTVSNTSLGKAILDAASRYSVPTILGGLAEKILPHLLNPTRLTDLAQLTGLSESALRKTLTTLMERGAVKREGWHYRLADDETLQRLAQLLKEKNLLKKVEPNASILYTNSFIIKAVPKGEKALGELTAFSRFPQYGVQFLTDRDYYVYPPTKIGPEKVLVHALLSSKSSYERSMCALFFLVNRTRIDIFEARKTAKHTPALGLLLDLENYVAGLPVSKPELFLPWNEFSDLCAVYGVKVEPAPSAVEIISNIEGWARKLKESVTAYLLGGVNMVLRQIKSSTKDIDLLVENSREYELIAEALQASGYEKAVEWSPGDRDAGPSNIFIHPTMLRVDLFTSKVGGIPVSDTVKARASSGMSLGKLRLMLFSLDDVAYMKLLTTRERDVSDAAEIIRRHGINWETFREEVEKIPPDILKRKAFVILENLDVLRMSYGLRIPRKLYSWLRRMAIDSGIKEFWKRGVDNASIIARDMGVHPSYVRRKLAELRRKRQV